MLSRLIHQQITILLLALFIIAGCDKEVKKEEDLIKGKWVREGTNGTGSGNTLDFSIKNGVYTLSFDCSGSPGPNWPSHAETEYRFNNGQLSYLNYADNSAGFYTTNSFNWIVVGESFEVKFHQILLFMSADYKVKYKRAD